MVFAYLMPNQWLLPILLLPGLSFQTLLCPAPSPQFNTPAYPSCLTALQTLLDEGRRENFEWPFRWRPEPVRMEDRQPDGRYCGKIWSVDNCHITFHCREVVELPYRELHFQALYGIQKCVSQEYRPCMVVDNNPMTTGFGWWMTISANLDPAPDYTTMLVLLSAAQRGQQPPLHGPISGASGEIENLTSPSVAMNSPPSRFNPPPLLASLASIRSPLPLRPVHPSLPPIRLRPSASSSPLAYKTA